LKDMTQTEYRYTVHEKGLIFVSNYTVTADTSRVNLHFHNGSEIIFITKGSCKLYAPEKIYEGSGPCIGIFQAGMFHACVFQNCENSPSNRYVVNYTQELLEMIPPHMLDTQSLFENDAVVIPLDDEFFPLLSVLFEKMYRFYQQQVAVRHSNEILPQLYGYITVILNTVADAYRRANAISCNSRKNDDEYIYKVIRELLKSVENDENISSESMAAQFFVSRTKFWTDFRRVTGKSFKQMTDELRLERIKKKLSNGLTNKEIAGQCGFSSESYFIQFFKKHTDMSPGDYRAMNRATSK